MRLHHMPPPGSRLIVAVSGGRDSLVLLHLLIDAGYVVEVAHMNYGLRGAESEEDEQFVRQLSGFYNLKCHFNKVDTQAFMQSERLSLQEAARQLRYQWFEKLIVQTGAKAVAVAHHVDDSIETMLVNLIRGTGIRGLAGIRPVNGNIIRPLGFAHAAEIEQYAIENKLSWRTDSSNLKDDYLRNRIRHHLLPLLKSIAGEDHGGLVSSMQLVSAQAALYASLADNLSKKLTQQEEEDVFRIRLDGLTDTRLNHAILYELISPFGFNSTQAFQMSDAIQSKAGKRFHSEHYDAYIGSKFIEISKISEDQPMCEVYPNTPKDCHFEFKLMDWLPGNTYPHDPKQAWLDYDTLALPLSLRARRPGDRFIPLGMEAAQKLSDFFINNHFTQRQKEQTQLVVDANNAIVWVSGYRIAQPNRITTKTRKVLLIVAR
jgi:tRNA(Ile)-lysidine synthase